MQIKHSNIPNLMMLFTTVMLLTSCVCPDTKKLNAISTVGNSGNGYATHAAC